LSLAKQILSFATNEPEVVRLGALFIFPFQTRSHCGIVKTHIGFNFTRKKYMFTNLV